MAPRPFARGSEELLVLFKKETGEEMCSNPSLKGLIEGTHVLFNTLSGAEERGWIGSRINRIKNGVHSGGLKPDIPIH